MKKKLPLSADKVCLSKKLTLSDQIIWVFSDKVGFPEKTHIICR